jgi:hypothetical protein
MRVYRFKGGGIAGFGTKVRKAGARVREFVLKKSDRVGRLRGGQRFRGGGEKVACFLLETNVKITFIFKRDERGERRRDREEMRDAASVLHASRDKAKERDVMRKLEW